VRECADIAPDDQGGRGDGPHRELGLSLATGHAQLRSKVVRVVPTSRTGSFRVTGVVVQVAQDVAELDVADEAHVGIRSPRVAGARPEAVGVVDRLGKARVVRAPRAGARREGIADIEKDGSVAAVRQQRVTELAVGGRRVELHLRSAAEVDLERVVTPGRELAGILLVVAVAYLHGPLATVT